MTFQTSIADPLLKICSFFSIETFQMLMLEAYRVNWIRLCKKNNIDENKVKYDAEGKISNPSFVGAKYKILIIRIKLVFTSRHILIQISHWQWIFDPIEADLNEVDLILSFTLPTQNHVAHVLFVFFYQYFIDFIFINNTLNINNFTWAIETTSFLPVFFIDLLFDVLFNYYLRYALIRSIMARK